ncbi:MAG: PEGA domain-containing protein [Deltaproteobacteria bacterium]|nr:PEGA domain-containing protein [Deltaproteobacteria bacterium]
MDLQISSEPGGAEVEIDGKVVGVTPLELTWPKSDAEVQVLVQLDGYQAWSSALVPDRAVSLTAQLNRKARSTRRTSSRGREDSASSKAPETPPKPASYRRFD